MSRKIEQQINNYLRFCKNVRRMTPATMETKVWICRDFLARTPHLQQIEDTSTQDVLDYISATAERGVSGRTVNARMSSLIPLFKYHLEMGIAIPGLNLHLIQKSKEKPPRRKFFTQEQVEEALKYADIRQWLLIKLAFDCGLRLSELTNLRLSNIDDCVVTVVGKGQKRGVMRMTKETRKRLDIWIKRAKVTDYLWESPRNPGNPSCKYVIRAEMKKPFDVAGIEGFYPHSLRHSFATNMQNKGATPMELQVMLRHSSIEISQRYLHGLDGRASDIFKKYEEMSPVSSQDKGDLRKRLLATAQSLASTGSTKGLEEAAKIYEILAKL